MSNSTEFDRLVEEYDADVRCVSCHELVTPVGCRCKLDRRYNDDMRAALDWWDALPEEDRNPQKGVKPVYAMLSALGTARRTAGLSGVPSRGDDNRSEADLERQSLADHLGVEPKWRKPTERPKPTPKPARGMKGTTVLPSYISR